MFRNRFLGGMSFLPMFDAEKGAGASGTGGAAGGGAGDGGVGAGGGAAAGAAGSAGGGAAAGAAPGAGVPGAGGADAGAAGGAGAGAAGGAGAGGAAGTGGTLAEGGTGGAAAALAAPPKFPEDWRAQLAGEDKSALTDLAKYNDPQSVYKSLRDLQAKISKGELKAPAAALPANATPEQKAEWRKSNGLPETAEAYVAKLSLPNGVVIGEADKPLVNDFAKSMFEQGASQAEMDRAVSWFYQQQDAASAQRTQQDGTTRVQSEVALRGEWGADFTPNMNAFGVFKATMPAELQASIFAARMPDGRLLGDAPEFLKLGSQLGRTINPAATLILPAGGDAGKTIGDEIKAIEATMYTNGQANREYWGDEKKQARYRELIDMQTKMSAQGKAA